MIKRECSERFNPSMRYAEDYELWLRIICLGGQASHLNIALAYIYRAEWSLGGLSGNLWAMQKGETIALLNVFWRKKILSPILLVAGIFSWVKFLRRILICKHFKIN